MKAKITAIIMALVLVVSFSSAWAIEDGFYTSYTYNYDYWEDVRHSPDAYKVTAVVYNADLGLDPMKNPESMYARDDRLYVCDTGNNRILELKREGAGLALVRVIDTLNGCEPAMLGGPTDVFADVEGNLYIADPGNERVVMVDKDLNFVKQFIKPSDSTFDQKQSFLPKKLVVDVAGRVYVLATNINKGLVKFEADGSFAGYIGANKVVYTMWDYLWKTYFMSEAQKKQTESFVPTEYENIYIDEEGFIYATNTQFSEYDLKYDNAKPIRRLNGIGDDILIKNDRYPPIGDLWWVEGTTDKGPSKFVDITVLENDIYVAFDRIRGRLFGYDSQGVMLWAFGTKGNDEGSFTTPSAIEHMGRDLICLDKNQGCITLFTPTEYGTLVYEALDRYQRGDYDGSADTWREVLKLNANYDLAFRGIGRSLLRQEDYKEAMRYFEMAHDRENYGRAFKQYRKIWVEKNIIWVVIVLLAVIVVWLGARLIRNAKREVIEYDRNRIQR